MIKAPLQIAIDGPVAAGKGDIAQRLGKRLGILHIYTGAMYRALALAIMQKNIQVTDTASVIDLAKKVNIELQMPESSDKESYQVFLNGQNISEEIIRPEVTSLSAKVSEIPEVRRIMVVRQQLLARDKAVAMEGRDIGLRVLPDSQIKIYLTASLEERARRRQKQLEKHGIQKKFDDVLSETKKRDLQDKSRFADPLQKLPDAWELDTTNLTQDEVVEKIINELNIRGLL